MGRAERRALVRRAHPELSVSRQCRLLSVGRSSLYYTTRGESEETLALMRRIDALFLKHPFYGARQMVRHLRREGVRIGRRRAGRLMRLLGLQAIYRAPRLSAPHPAHRVYPYLLKGVNDRAGEPGLVRRHHLHPSALRVPVPRSDHGLGEPACAGLAAVEHPRRGLLRRSPRRRAGPPWPAGDLQHRPGQPVHERRLHRALAGRRHPDLDGRPGPIEDLLFRSPGRPSLKPLIRYKSFQYQADSWTTPRRVVAKVEHHVGELFPRVGFIVTNLPIHNRADVRFYNKRGTAEQWIKGRQAGHALDAAVVPSISSERGPAAAERTRVQLGESVAAASPAHAHRALVIDQPAAAPGQDGRAVGKTRALLLAVPGGESHDPTPVRGDAPADLGATGPGRLTRGECKDAGLAKRGHK